jgi:hypothetical protein
MSCCGDCRAARERGSGGRQCFWPAVFGLAVDARDGGALETDKGEEREAGGPDGALVVDRAEQRGDEAEERDEGEEARGVRAAWGRFG